MFAAALVIVVVAVDVEHRVMVFPYSVRVRLVEDGAKVLEVVAMGVVDVVDEVDGVDGVDGAEGLLQWRSDHEAIVSGFKHRWDDVYI